MKISKKTILVGVALLVAGYLLGKRGTHGQLNVAQSKTDTEESAIQFWTCSMHPQVHEDEPGQCPYCGMDLVPVRDEHEDVSLGPRELKLSPQAEKLAEVEVSEVQRKFVTKEIRMAGKVEYDETRLGHITAWVPGRLERLFVDYTGVEVEKGDHMVQLYSPELLAAQEELNQARKTVEKLDNSDIRGARERAVTTLEATREKLRLWGLTQEQIREIERTAEASQYVTISAPNSGTVIEKHALEGAYVQTGTRIYTVADLSRVWVKLDAYESDLAWLHYGQDVAFTTEAYPGKDFHGKIAFIDPILNPKTRTVKIRVNVENPEQELKPEMFVRAVVKSRIAKGGRVFSPDLAGKWISPMHPEIVKDEPGTCDICGMTLVSAESLGYVLGEPEQAPLVIPATAPLITGERAVVYVKNPHRLGIYQGREIRLGPRAGEYYLVKGGLQEGELVVRRGNFKIDSAVQIMAKPSMMNPEGGGPAPGHSHGGSETKHGERPVSAAGPAQAVHLGTPEEDEHDHAGSGTQHEIEPPPVTPAKTPAGDEHDGHDHPGSDHKG